MLFECTFKLQMQFSVLYVYEEVKNGCRIAPALGFMSRLTTYQGDWLSVSPEDESRDGLL